MESCPRILIADDEELFLLSTADLLRQEGYEVDCATDGREASRLLSERPYDLLVSDIRMPGNAGLALLEDLPEPNRGLPVILMTGYPSAETAIQAVNRSVLAYLVKPMEFRDLAAQVQRGVAQRRVQRSIGASARRIQDWASEMAALAAGGPNGAPLQQVLGAMLGRMGESLMDLKQLLDLTAALEPDGRTCTVERCPRLEGYQRVLQEGIGVLEQTKGAFKSRHLEDLRHKMEGVMEKRST